MASKGNHNGKVGVHKGIRNPNRRNGKASKKNPKCGTVTRLNTLDQVAAYERTQIKRFAKMRANAGLPSDLCGSDRTPKREKAFPHAADTKAWDHIIANNFGRETRA